MVTISIYLSLQFQHDEVFIIDIPDEEATKTKLLMLSVDPCSYYQRLMEELTVNHNENIISRDIILEQLRSRSSTLKDVKTPGECKALHDQCFENILNAADTYIAMQFSDFDIPYLLQ